MLQQLINHSPDIKKLVDDGYDLEIIGGAYLLARNIPFVTSTRQVSYGTIVTVLTLVAPNQVGVPPDHTVYFIGDKPCDAQGQPLMSIINSSGNQQLATDIQINHYFSSKPISGNYRDYYEKVRTYAEILSAQAKILDPQVSARPNRVMPVVEVEPKTPFNYPDTNSARAKIDNLNHRFIDLKIAIVGLGGTGSYILDLLAKCPVKEIHIFDGDTFQVHNAFRAPGAISAEGFSESDNLYKVRYFKSVYSKMHKGIIDHETFLDDDSIIKLREMDYVFIAVDNNKIRQLIFKHATAWNIAVIDVGIGVNQIEDKLIGTIRVTSAYAGQYEHLDKRVGKDEPEINEYHPNIQIADLNCLNAVFAVIKWKKCWDFIRI